MIGPVTVEAQRGAGKVSHSMVPSKSNTVNRRFGGERFPSPKLLFCWGSLIFRFGERGDFIERVLCNSCQRELSPSRLPLPE